MIFLKRKYASAFTSMMSLGQKVDSDTWNFRCPYCGDSKKDPKKARGYIYSHDQDLLYKCHNCGESTTMISMLKRFAPLLYKDYIKEAFKHRNHPGAIKQPKKEPEQFQDPPEFKELSETKFLETVGITPVHGIDEAEDYLVSRAIPKKYWDRIFFAKNFRTSDLQLSRKTGSNKYSDPPAIAFKLHDAKGKWIGVQFRTISKDAGIRYKINQFRTGNRMYFGTDVNPKPNYVVEGPFDSFFLPNAIAVCGSDMTNTPTANDETTYVIDCEPRNKQIIKKYRKLILLNRKIVLLPHKYAGKDLNDLAKDGMSEEEIKTLVDEYTYRGLSASLVLAEWKRI